MPYHIESTEASSSGFGRSPDRRMSSSKDHHSRLKGFGKYEQTWSKLKRGEGNSIVNPFNTFLWPWNYHIISADGTANRKNSLMPLKASHESGARVSSQEGENLTYRMSSKTLNQSDMLIASEAPTFPRPNLNTITQHRGTWKHSVAKEVKNKGRIRLWDWRNFMSGWMPA